MEYFIAGAKMISGLTWIRKGVAKQVPEKFELTEDEYNRIMEETSAEIQSANTDLKE